MIEWVVLDVGEVLIDETRVWATWAAAIGVSPLTFGAALGAAIVRDLEHAAAFELLGVSDWQEHAEDVDRSLGGLKPEDLYPDALRSIATLHAQGRRVAVFANQPARRHAQLLDIGIRVDAVGMSEEMGVAKPHEAFFIRSLELMGGPDPRAVAYVGDRIDNDIAPARRCGLNAIWLRRGPWGRLQVDLDHDADLVVWSLDELVRRLPELDGEHAMSRMSGS